jgi:hypothetical protein
MVQFVSELATYESVRSPPTRSENLLFVIFKQLAAQDPRPDENPLLDFIRGVPESAFARLTSLCPQHPEQPDSIPNALTESVLPASFLGPLLELSTHDRAVIQANAIRIVQKHFYKTEAFCAVVDRFERKARLGAWQAGREGAAADD